jgi:hypothetical protein
MNVSIKYTWPKQTAEDTVHRRTRSNTVLPPAARGETCGHIAKSLLAQILRTVPNRVPDEWLLHPPVHNVATKETPCSTVDNGECRIFPNTKKVEPDPAGLYGLHAKVQMEADSNEEREGECRKLPQNYEWVSSATGYPQGWNGRSAPGMCTSSVVSDEAQTWGNFDILFNGPNTLVGHK